MIELVVLDARLHGWGLPVTASAMAAAVDLRACLDAPLTLAPSTAPEKISCGFALHMADAGMAALILPRSGLGHRGLVLGNLVGLIDADYQGPVTVSAWNRSDAAITVAPGERFAQLLFVPVLRPAWRVVDAFSGGTARATAGFGSTGSG